MFDLALGREYWIPSKYYIFKYKLILLSFIFVPVLPIQ